MLVEELMILANEAVAGLLAGRKREALYRVHERPIPRRLRSCSPSSPSSSVPTPPAPEHLTPAGGGPLAPRRASA